MYRDIIMILLLVLFPQRPCKNWTGCLPSKHARIDTDFLEKLKVLSHPSRSLFLWFCPKDQWLSCYMLTYVNITWNTCICLCCNMYLFNPIYIIPTLIDQRDSMWTTWRNLSLAKICRAWPQVLDPPEGFLASQDLWYATPEKHHQK